MTIQKSCVVFFYLYYLIMLRAQDCDPQIEESQREDVKKLNIRMGMHLLNGEYTLLSINGSILRKSLGKRCTHIEVSIKQYSFTVLSCDIKI